MGRGRFDIRGKTVFITGPARGIGAEAARRLAGRGARLALAGVEPDLLEKLAEEIGPGAACWEADVRDRRQVEEAVVGAIQRFGGIDVAIANAGIAPVGTIEGMGPAEFEDVVQVNLLGAWRTLRATAPHVAGRRGYVLAIASLASFVHLPLMAAYAAAKAGVWAMTDVLRTELEGTGARVGAAYFGFIDTDMTRQAYEQPQVRSIRERGGRLLMPRPLPVEAAGAAIVRGIERRARWIVVPRTALPVLLAPSLFQRLAEAQSRRLRVAELIRDEGAGIDQKAES